MNITFTLDSNDKRPAFICEDGKDIELTGWNIPETSNAPSIIRLEHVEKARISNMNVKGTADEFVSVEGESKDIQLGKNKTPGIKTKTKVTTILFNQNNCFYEKRYYSRQSTTRYIDFSHPSPLLRLFLFRNSKIMLYVKT